MTGGTVLDLAMNKIGRVQGYAAGQHPDQGELAATGHSRAMPVVSKYTCASYRTSTCDNTYQPSPCTARTSYGMDRMGKEVDVRKFKDVKVQTPRIQTCTLTSRIRRLGENLCTPHRSFPSFANKVPGHRVFSSPMLHHNPVWSSTQRIVGRLHQLAVPRVHDQLQYARK
ncbi:hypothetical protein AUEXF2481DRAFT_136805 [Aureobasidium subglaciale EXF-2481]|uniref:Uncharacterized protein n=1 Tax=Aureobasidium subglaciale (strain EXF-2481) TaxID=1043005 RepID=A0A074Z270_AURSE|nr:uncharacterized protein AUEXF2481DRAFT_136805 [Aureobasidium subglaciale EXF-2481]KER00448.1 hypothetical protein AUEXF2481DRAFT_136805 [Aureobasidium subglaciale EXF-2481]